MKERLQKILAKSGLASRRTAEQFIKEGKVAIDGKIVTEMGCQIDPQKHKITFEGKPLPLEEEKIYILLNKPTGYVTTMSDPQGRPIVTSLLKEVSARVFPVGRLDLDTEGALLMTNDGELANRVIHPRHEVNKTYVAKVKGHPSRKKLAQLEKGIEIDGHKTWPAKLSVLDSKPSFTIIKIIIHEGKKRQVRKMFAAIDHPVLTLKRTAYGELKLGKLALGKYRFLTKKELDNIFL